ncbi:hypothetical protein ACSBR2_007739 [Camellia fascicularis]
MSSKLKFMNSCLIPSHVTEIADPVILNNEEEEVQAIVAAASNTWEPLQVNSGNKMVECLISMVKIGVACSTESPQGQMSMSNILHELHLVKEKLLQGKLSTRYEIKGGSMDNWTMVGANRSCFPV